MGRRGLSFLEGGRPEKQQPSYPEVGSHGLSLHVGRFFWMTDHLQGVYLGAEETGNGLRMWTVPSAFRT